MNQESKYAILRVRHIIDHDQDHITHTRSEYTLQSAKDSLGDIIIVFPKFLPNLKVSDSDGTVYPIMPNEHVKKMLAKNQGGVIGRPDTTQILDDIETHKKFLVWVKIPPNKHMNNDEVRIIYFDYDSDKADESPPNWLNRRTKKIVLNVTPVEFPVFWILKKPEGYDLGSIEYHEPYEHGKLSSSKLSENPNAYVHQTTDSNSFHIKKPSKYVAVSYSFYPKRSVVAVPIIFVTFLTLLSSVLLADLVYAVNIHDETSVLTSEKFTLAIFIMASTMVIPRLIPYVEIRHSYRWWYAVLFVPVAIYLAFSIILSW